MTSAPRSANSIPAHGPVMKVPCSTIRIPVSAGSMPILVLLAKSTGVIRNETGRNVPVILDGARRGVRHHKADRALLLLEQMSDQAGRARQQRHAFQGQQRI